MKALIQRVKRAQVYIDKITVGQIKQGLVVFVAVEKNDTIHQADKLLHKIMNYRVFADESDKMNLSLIDVHGDILLVSQFTLLAETKKGLRPSFAKAGDPEHSKKLYDYMIEQAEKSDLKVQTGKFAADMQVSLINDGPVTFNLSTN